MPLVRILPFLAEIGIQVREGTLGASTFVPGIRIDAGTLVIERTKLFYPGDVLHEAGHIAVVPPSARPRLSDNLQTGDWQHDLGNEIAAIAWSYAAALHVGIDPALVFHPHGYRGASSAYIENFAAGRYVGLPLLAWFGMTQERDTGSGEAVYPQMSQWLRPEPAASLT